MEKKTAKYYRDILKKGASSEVIRILPEVIKKYGRKRWDKYSKGNDIINVRKWTEFNWNHRIESFFLTDKGELCIDIYWQGDSTDGNDSLRAASCINGNIIRAKYEFLGDRTYCEHSDIRISREEFSDAVKAVATYLSPEEIKARKEADRKGEIEDKVYALVANLTDNKDEAYWNGRMGVQRLLESEPDILDKEWDEVKRIVTYVYKRNNRSSYYLKNDRGTKEYDLEYPAKA